MSIISSFIQNLLDHAVFTCLLISAPLLYMLCRVRIRGILWFWLLLLPTALASQAICFGTTALCSRFGLDYLAPFCNMLIAAIISWLTVKLINRRTKIVADKEMYRILLVVVFLMCMAAEYAGAGKFDNHIVGESALLIWLALGFAILCFVSMGSRLRPVLLKSRFGGIAIFYLTIAAICCVLAGFQGLSF